MDFEIDLSVLKVGQVSPFVCQPTSLPSQADLLYLEGSLTR